MSEKEVVKIIKIGVTSVIIAVIALILIFGSFYRVSEQENAVVTMFGNVVRTDTSGLHFKIPIIQQVKKVDITTHGTGIGYVVSEDGQNISTNDDGIMITSDFNLLNIDFYMEYRVTDPVAYLYNSNCPEEVLKNIALSNIRSIVVNYTVDEAMTTAKGQIQQEVKEKISEALAEQNIGLSVINITIQDSEPPTADIIAAFKSVETAKQGADTTMNNALQYQNEKIPEAEANADQIIQQAEAQKAARIAEAEGQVARFNSMYEEYLNYPLITKQRLFYETLEEILPDLKVIITDGDTETMLPLDSFSLN
ncbi:MAG: FtsH protease activity modulator HflK [Bacilli bacterium]|nr:FtsH protease activity modulator HflK [Bacilli bacterium]MBQ8218699.1 FtsH protease activity modulator HflK [Bacilli bacterium]